jgi:uncharacterized membrane protein YgdD (TMEM256/DUF423 family)
MKKMAKTLIKALTGAILIALLFATIGMLAFYGVFMFLDFSASGLSYLAKQFGPAGPIGAIIFVTGFVIAFFSILSESAKKGEAE